MNAAVNAARQTIDVAWLLLQAGTRNLVGHWSLAVFSLLIATGTWFVIQDVENPRVEGVVPLEGEQEIRVEFVNSSADVTVVDSPVVRVRVEAREEVLNELRATDFRAVVDLQGLEAGEVLDLDVMVTPVDRDVRVLEVIPSSVPVELVPVFEREFEVSVKQTENGALPVGYELAAAPVIEPRFVTVRGTRELVDNVDRVELDVNFAGRRADFEVTGDLVARNANGQAQTVALSSRQATASFSVEQIVQQREFAVRPDIDGVLEDGYRVAAVRLNPPVVRLTGPDDVLDGITEVVLEEMDVAGASDDVTRTVEVRPIDNVTLTPQQVEVTVVIEPIGCDEDGDDACAHSIVLVAPNFGNAPAGLVLAPGVHTVRVEVAGSPLDLAALDPDDIVVAASLTGLTAGVHTITPQVTAPENIEVVNTSTLTVQLQASP